MQLSLQEFGEDTRLSCCLCTEAELGQRPMRLLTVSPLHTAETVAQFQGQKGRSVCPHLAPLSYAQTDDLLRAIHEVLTQVGVPQKAYKYTHLGKMLQARGLMGGELPSLGSLFGEEPLRFADLKETQARGSGYRVFTHQKSGAYGLMAPVARFRKFKERSYAITEVAVIIAVTSGELRRFERGQIPFVDLYKLRLATRESYLLTVYDTSAPDTYTLEALSPENPLPEKYREALESACAFT